MRVGIVVVLAAVLLGGCLTPEMNVVCKGKGQLAIQGGPYAGMIAGDCGDGFEYHRWTPGAVMPNGSTAPMTITK